MGISQVNTNNVNIVKLALAKKGINGSRNKNVPEYLTRSGSIFKAPGATSTESLNEANTKYTLEDLQRTNQPAAVKKKTKEKNEQEEPDVSVSGGKAAMSAAKGNQSKAESLTKTVEKDNKTVTKFAENAEKNAAEVAKNDKAFVAQFKQQQDAIKKDNDKIAKLIKENEEQQREIDDLQKELDEINASSDEVKGGKAGRAGEIKGLLGTKVGLLQKNGKAIYSLQRSSSRSLSKMNRVQTKYLKAQQKNAKQVANQQSETSDVLKVAQTAEEISSITQSGGQALGLLGKLFVAVGSATSGFFGIGAALVAIGKVMQTVGKVVELVGTYGMAAAQITKTAAYAAEGNLMGAAMSLGSAIQSATSCIKGTKGLKAEFGKINDEAQAATEKIAAKEVAKETIAEATKGMTKDGAKEALGGMSKKQARKQLTNELRYDMAKGELTSTAKGVSGKVKDLKQQMKDGWSYEFEGETLTISAKDELSLLKDNYKSQQMITAKEKGLSLTTDWDEKLHETANKKGYHVIDKDGNITDKVISKKKYDKAVNKAFNNDWLVKDIPGARMDWGGNITALGNSVQNIASVLSTNDALNTFSNGKRKQLPPAQLDARTRRIMEKNQRYRAIRGYAA